MDDLNKSSRSDTSQPSEVPSDMPAADERRRVLPEGQIPGLPVSHDPLLQPMPNPSPRDVPPLD